MPKPTPEQEASLEKVTKARAAYIVKTEGLRAHFEELYQKARRDAHLELGQAVRDAFDDGNKIEWIKRAYDTKDFNTIKRLLDLVPSTRAVEEEAEQKNRYQISDEGDLVVQYESYGPDNITGYGWFEVVELGEGEILLNENAGSGPSTDDDVMRVLDGRDEGFYFEDAVRFLKDAGRIT